MLKEKKIIIGIILSLMVIAIIITIVLINIEEDVNREMGSGGEEELYYEYGKIDSDEINNSNYYAANYAITMFLNLTKKEAYLQRNDLNEIKVDTNAMKKSIYNVLSTSYIDKNKITLDNVLDKIIIVDSSVKYVPIKAKVLKNDKVMSYLSYGLVEDYLDYSLLQEVSFIVNIDLDKNIYSIEPMYNIKFEDVKFDNMDITIKENENNKFTYLNLTDKEICDDYIDSYKRIALVNPEFAYELLDEQYRQKRFGNVQDFVNYVKNNRESIKKIRTESFEVNKFEDYNEYIVTNQYGIKYVIKEKAPLDYTIKLDTYTIPSAEDIEEYNTMTNAEKVNKNIDIFFQMLNSKDYSAAYSHLSDGFKSNYFKTEASFETYMRQNLYDSCEIYQTNFSDKISGVFTKYVEIKDKSKKNSNMIRMNIIMQLQEGTDYVLSFEIL